MADGVLAISLVERAPILRREEVREMEQDNLSGFWSGFGSALALDTATEHPLNFDYHGKDIGSSSVNESLVSDWLCIGSVVMEVAEREEADDEDI